MSLQPNTTQLKNDLIEVYVTFQTGLILSAYLGGLNIPYLFLFDYPQDPATILISEKNENQVMAFFYSMSEGTSGRIF